MFRFSLVGNFNLSTPQVGLYQRGALSAGITSVVHDSDNCKAKSRAQQERVNYSVEIAAFRFPDVMQSREKKVHILLHFGH